MTRKYIIFLLLIVPLLSFSTDESSVNIQLKENSGEILLGKAKAYYHDSLSQAELFSKESIKFSEENNQKDLEARAYLLHANVLFAKKDKLEALKSFFKARDIAKEISNDSILINANLSIGNIYYSLNKDLETFDYLTQAVILAEQNNDLNSLPSIYNAISRYYYKKKNYESSLNYLTKSYEGYILIGDTIQALVPFQKTIWVYYHLNDTAKAKESAYEAFELLRKIDSTNGDINYNSYYVLKASLNIFMGYFMANESYEEALKYILQGLEVAEEKGFIEWRVRGYGKLSEIYSNNGEYEKAYEALANNKIATDTLKKIEQREKIEVITLEKEALRSEKKISMLENKSKVQFLYIIIGICFSIFIISLFIFYYIRIKLKNKIHKQDKIELDLRINQKSREIVSSALLISEKIKTIKSIKESVDCIVLPEDSPSNSELKEVKRKLSETIQVDNNWEKIKLHFQEINPTFFKRIKENHSTLSSNDLKHCAYIYMNISTNDVAQLMNVSIRTVETSRYRIKKKMALESGCKLYEELLKY